MHTLAKASFELAGFDRTLASPARIVHAIRESHLTPRERATMLWVLTADADGVPPGLDPKTTRRYRKLAQQLGLTMTANSRGPTIRLDWATGQQVTTRD
jgi:hypothetical protein